MDRWTYALFFFSHLFETFFQDSSEQKPNFIFNESIIKYSIFIILTKLILNIDWAQTISNQWRREDLIWMK